MKTKFWLSHYDAGVPASLQYPDMPVQAFLHQAAEKFPARACTIYQDQPISYASMHTLSTQLACSLVQLGVVKGDRIGILMPNLPQFVLAYYAILKAGGVVVALNPLYKSAELAYQLQDAGVRVLFTLEDFLPALQAMQPSGMLKTIILSKADDGFQLEQTASRQGHAKINPEGRFNLLDLLGWHAECPLPGVHGDDVAIFQYTGGTTGIPKGAIGLHRNLVANTLQFRHWLVGVHDGSEVVLAAIPFFHVYGMVIGMHVGVCAAASLVLIPSAREVTDILRNIEHHHATLFPGVPNMYNAINRHPDVLAGKYNLHSIKACISGSAPLLRTTKQEFETLTGGKLIEGYGLSEAPTATHCNPVLGENRTGSIGLPLPDVEARIVDLDTGTRQMPIGKVGELVVRGPQVMQGYHNMPEETANALRDGWLFTGDIARMDGDGYFYLVDRKKELIKIGGFQVWPREIEEVLAAHPGVLEAAAAGIPDPRFGESVKAWVVARPGSLLTGEEMQAWCEERLAHFKVPASVEFIESLPRSTVGKVLRRELVKREISAQ